MVNWMDECPNCSFTYTTDSPCLEEQRRERVPEVVNPDASPLGLMRAADRIDRRRGHDRRAGRDDVGSYERRLPSPAS
jgi:hypothetical protein